MNKKLLKTLIILGVVVLALIVVLPQSCSIVGPTEKGMIVRLGEPIDKTYESGLHFKAPFITKMVKYSVSPVEILCKIELGENAALSKDTQDIGVTAIINYRYELDRMYDIVRNYKGDKIRNLVNNAFINAVKAQIGKYTIGDLVQNNEEIRRAVEQGVKNTLSVSNVPVTIVQLTLDNFDFPVSFSKQIEKSMEMTQQVKQAEQAKLIAEQKAQEDVVKAKAEKEAAELKADALKISAEAEATAMKVKNKAIQETLAIQRESWTHDERMKYYEKWDGHLEGASAQQFIVTPNYSGLKIDTK